MAKHVGKTLRISVLVGFFMTLAHLPACNLRTPFSASFLSYNHPLAKIVVGVWTGELPCADCEGIQYSLELNSEGLFREESVYKGENKNLFITEGVWKIQKDSSVVLITDDEIHKQLKLVPGGLLMHDMMGNKIQTSFEDMYMLKREDQGILQQQENRLNDRWKLEEINGKVIEEQNFQDKPPYIEFLLKKNKVLGYGGCNRFSGNFTVDSSKVKFDAIMSTKMACDNLSIETTFFSAISNTSFVYEISDESLALKNGSNKLVFHRFTTNK